MNKPAIIILAAGKAARFGSAKQVASFNGTTLLQHVIKEALAAQAEPVVVVTGAHAESVAATASQPSVEVVYNEHWEDGMASGIVAGVSFLLSRNKETENLIIAVCDQPFVSAQLFIQLIERSHETKGIVACAYADTLGTPVLFTRAYFTALLQLKGDEGAKKIVKQHAEDVAALPFPQGIIDIDTPEDYERLKESQRHVL